MTFITVVIFHGMSNMSLGYSYTRANVAFFVVFTLSGPRLDRSNKCLNLR